GGLRQLPVGLRPPRDAGGAGPGGPAAALPWPLAGHGHAGPGHSGVRPGPAGVGKLLGLPARPLRRHLLLARPAGEWHPTALVIAWPRRGVMAVRSTALHAQGLAVSGRSMRAGDSMCNPR